MHSLIVIVTVKFPFIGHIPMLQVCNRAIAGRCKNIILRTGSTGFFKEAFIIRMVPRHSQQRRERASRARSIGNNMGHAAADPIPVIFKIPHSGFQIHNTGRRTADKAAVLTRKPSAPRSHRYGHITMQQRLKKRICPSQMIVSRFLRFSRHITAHCVGKENRRRISVICSDGVSFPIGFRNIYVHFLIFRGRRSFHINQILICPVYQPLSFLLCGFHPVSVRIKFQIVFHFLSSLPFLSFAAVRPARCTGILSGTGAWAKVAFLIL